MTNACPISGAEKGMAEPIEPVVIVAIVSDYDQLIQALITHRKALGFPQAAVDEIAGLQPGYCGKIECQARGLGKVSLPRVLAGLGLRLAVLRGDNAGEVEELAREEAGLARRRGACRRAA